MSPTSTLLSFTHTLTSSDCSGSRNLSAWGAGAVKCSLLFQQPLYTMVGSAVNWGTQLHVPSVSEVHHLTCHQELNGVSAQERSLLCPGLHTKFFYHVTPNSQTFSLVGELTRSLLSCFPQALFLACGLRLQQDGPKICSPISLLIFCIQHKPV